MRNLRQSVAKVLINTLTTTKGCERVGLYQDFVSKKKVLSFKEEGLNILGDAVNGTTATAPAASGTLFSGFQGSKACHEPGNLQFQLVEIAPACPCDLCDYGYRITLEKHVKEIGIANNENNTFRKSFVGNFPTISCSGTPSMIDSEYVEIMIDDLATQISHDLGQQNQNIDPVTSNVIMAEGRKAYKITTVDTKTFNITIDGVTTTLTAGTDAIATAHVVNNSSAVQASVMAVAMKDTGGTGDEILLISRKNGKIFTVTMPAGSTCVINNRYLALVSKSVDVQFAVQFDGGFATVTKHRIAFLTGNTAAGTTLLSTTIAGATVPMAAAAADDVIAAGAYAIELQAHIAAVALLLANTAATWDTYGNRTMVYGSPNIQNWDFTFSATSTTVIDKEYSGTGQWATLTGAEVFGIFFNQKDAGVVSAMTYLDQINPEDTYCKYVLNVDAETFAHHGANHNNGYTQEIHVYVKQGMESVKITDKTNPAGLILSSTYNQTPNTNDAAEVAFVADSSLEEMLAIWAGVATTAW